MNNNVYRGNHLNSWNNNLGKNFTNNQSDIYKYAMAEKNIETGGGYQASVSGAYGEFTVSAVFKSLPSQYHILNDILLQQGVKIVPYNGNPNTPWKVITKHGRQFEIIKKSTQIDHIIVSPYGLYIIETKNHKGWVFGDINGKVWTQVLNGENNNRAYGGHDHYKFYNPVKQNETHILELCKQLRINRNLVQGLIVFTNPDAYLGNVNCNCCLTLNELYNAITYNRRVLWEENKSLKIIKAIEHINTNSYSNAIEHENYVNYIKNK